MRNEDDTIEIDVKLTLRGPVFTTKMLERALEAHLAEALEATVQEVVHEEVTIWDIVIDNTSEKTLTHEELED